MYILALETSCDDTAAAVVEQTAEGVFVRSSVVSSQIALHAPYGGVVPNLAAREHAKNIVPVIEAALRSASIHHANLNLIAVTQGPGLIPALLVGTTAAKMLSFLWHKPLIGIHHIEGHIYANFIRQTLPSVGTENQTPLFPLLALVVSGGHTQLMLMRDHFQYEILGETQDDAVGECFDKTARLLGLPYPGGPIVAKRADTFRLQTEQSAIKHASPPIKFPRPMLLSGDLHFSFSGLKTSVLYFLKKHEDDLANEDFISEVCHEFQEAAVDVLVGKTTQALREYQPRTFVIAGGVSANKQLRERLQTTINQEFSETTFLTPEFQYSLDNAAMIGAAAAFRFAALSPDARHALTQSWRTLDPNANLTLSHV
ncbi:MAG: tRNA (adenosine(37)-N6)-threonylcarbamoyltransferase complex transferase subunit TsaD [Candidatus Moranbacteria bacterium]|jgi:N6-L-threonylcarbamoyladenine synthase|nr:tRNA (adenosine(37)-N6)-threonylcarbamoyltransferase complex transferase subunit TsaD [Candidatus Moranbacteria bacterium]MBP9801888.1 tRNA (adenosine(37)-N6)-threonylcarbamoyltransferase complex transferase subunit TsaD [Candidatus Moranbacteria bacterium]